MLTSHKRTLAFILFVVLRSQEAQSDERQESVYVIGIHGTDAQRAFLTARLVSCNDNIPDGASILKTTDGGAHWLRVWSSSKPSSIQVAVPNGPEPLFIGSLGSEGPDLDPFSLAQIGDGRRKAVTIHRGPSKIEAVYQGDDGVFVTLRQIDLHFEEWTGPLRTYRSKDGGNSWKLSSKQGIHLRSIAPISKSSGNWTMDFDNHGGCSVRRADAGSVQVVSKFPAPSACK